MANLNSIFANIFKWTNLAMAGVVVAESTMAGEPGASKQQRALDIITAEAGLVGAALPNQAGLANSIVNMVVAGFNIAGLFQHKPAA